jgi:hypothetical protein
MLLVYDAISTWGLFLTQQSKFRKVDWKRISDTTIPPFDLDGRELSQEETAQLALFAHCLLKTVSLRKESVFVSINPLRSRYIPR